MTLRILLNRKPLELAAATPVATAASVAREERLSARKAKAQASATPPPTLTSDRTTVIASAPSSAPAKSAKKVNQTVNKTPSGPSLYDRVCTTRNLEIAIGSAAVAAAIGVWASKVGTLAASQIVAANTVAFLTPGLTICGFALKTGTLITVNTVTPVMSGLIAISLPIISTIVVTAIGGFILLHIMNKMIQQVKDSVNSGLTTMKDTVTGLPETLLKQVPGYSFVSSLFSSSKEQESAARQERLRNEIEQAHRKPEEWITPSLPYFEGLRDAAKNEKERAMYENTVAVLKGERQSGLAYTPAPSNGLADILEEKSNPSPQKRIPGLVTRPGSSRKKSS